jgi:phage-related protein
MNSAIVKTVFADIATAVGTAIALISGVIGNVTSWISDHWTTISTDTSTAWKVISNILAVAWNLISGIISVALAVIVPMLKVAWDIISTAVKVAWDIISTIIGTEITVIIAVIKTIISIVSFLAGVWQTVTSGVSGFIGGVVTFFTKLPRQIINALGNVGTMLFNIGASIITGLLNGIKSAMNDVKNFVSGIAGSIMSWKGPLDYDATILIPHGNAIMAGLVAGIQQGLNGPVKAALGQVTSTIAGTSLSPMSLGAGNLAVAGGGVAGIAGLAGGRQINIAYNIPVTGDMSPQTALFIRQQLQQQEQQLITTLNAL